MITKEQFKELGISVSTELIGNAALEWLEKNTTLPVDLNDATALDKLPFAARLFISKYDEIISAPTVVTSESIEGLSQSFNQTAKSELLWQAAEELLSDYLKGQVRFVSASKRWR